MSSYKTFLNAVRAAVKKVECKVDGFIKRATDKYNELAYVPIYETPLEDFYTAALKTDYIMVGSGFPELEVDKEYLVTIGNVQYKSVARVITNGGETGVYIGSNPLAPRLDDGPYTVLSAAGLGLITVAEAEVGKTMTIQKIGETVEVGKEWLHDYVDERDDKLTEAVGSAQTTAETAKTTAETAKSTAETAKSTAETAKTTAETALKFDGNTGYVVSTAISPVFTDNCEILGIICPAATEVRGSAFARCCNLKFADIHNVSKIGKAAFFQCKSLLSMVIPNGVASIEDSTFYGCVGLTDVVIGSDVESIDDYGFYECSSLTSITVVNGNKVYHSDNNCVIETEKKKLVVGGSAAIIPADGSVTEIGNRAFNNNPGLTTINIPDRVTRIGAQAFLKCTGLTTINIPASLDAIVGYAFEKCTSLTSITYTGTMEQWNAVFKGTGWNEGVPATEVVCSDGSVPLTTTET